MIARSDWTLEELNNLYKLPFMELVAKAHASFIQSFRIGEVQVCSLISIKTGGCPEDCKYCAQSSYYKTNVAPQPMMKVEEVISRAKEAKKYGASRICLGAAWREVKDGKQFEEVLRMIQGIASLGLEVCCTLGMLQEHHAKRLKEAGLYAYNHNLDSSEGFYKTIITTRTYQDRLDTLDIVQNASLSVCCGGILGLGESVLDRLELLHTLCTRKSHPDSVPINRLTPVGGTPLEKESDISVWEMIRVVAIARIVMPKSMVRLSCGRDRLTLEQQALCFFAGANSIFMGEKLLTVGNPRVEQDERMFEILGLKHALAGKTIE